MNYVTVDPEIKFFEPPEGLTGKEKSFYHLFGRLPEGRSLEHSYRIIQTKVRFVPISSCSHGHGIRSSQSAYAYYSASYEKDEHFLRNRVICSSCHSEFLPEEMVKGVICSYCSTWISVNEFLKESSLNGFFRCPHCLSANDALTEPSFNLECCPECHTSSPVLYPEDHNGLPVDIKNTNLLKFVERSFSSYQRARSEWRRHVLLCDDEGTLCLLPAYDRFTSSYAKDVESRMRWLAYHYRSSTCVVLVLTVDPKCFNGDKLIMWDSFRGEVNRFLTALRLKLKRESRPMPSYIATIEAQKSENSRGNPHLHILFFGASRLFDWRVIRDLWGCGHVFINRTYHGEKIRSPVSYVTKYITKTFCETSDGNRLIQALSWFFGVRSFSTSRGLIKPLRCPGSGVLECLGIVMSSLNPAELFGYLKYLPAGSFYCAPHDLECG